MTDSLIHRVTTLDLSLEPWAWPFAIERRADIDAYFAIKQREKPQLWNGRILLARNPVSHAIASAPAISRPISRASWRARLGLSGQAHLQRHPCT